MIVLKDPADRAAAIAALGLLVVKADSADTIVIPAPDGADSSWERCAGWMPPVSPLTDVTLRRPSLDDVFFAFTEGGDVTEAAMGRPTRSAIKQWWVLTTRVIAPTFRTGEFFVAIAMSVAFTVSLYVPLKQIMGHVVHGSYAQWIMPSICMQAICFAAMSGALRSATDSVDRINRRLASMPMPRSAPMAARMSANFYRAGVALCDGARVRTRDRLPVLPRAVVHRRVLRGRAVDRHGAGVGRRSGGKGLHEPEATTHILLLPQLMFAMLSVGLQPVDQFPAWLQPVVRNQPHSQFVSILRAIAGNAEGTTATPSLSVIGPGLLWLLGVVVVTAWLYARVLRGGHDCTGQTDLGADAAPPDPVVARPAVGDPGAGAPVHVPDRHQSCFRQGDLRRDRPQCAVRQCAHGCPGRRYFRLDGQRCAAHGERDNGLLSRFWNAAGVPGDRPAVAVDGRSASGFW